MIFLLTPLTLILGIYLTLEDLRAVVICSVGVAIATIIMKIKNGTEDFFLSFDETEEAKKNTKVVVAGLELTPEGNTEKKTSRLLHFFQNTSKINKYATYFICFAPTTFALNKFGCLTPLALMSLLPALVLLNSIYVGHLLIAFFINLALVVANFHPDHSFIIYFLYAGLFYYSLSLIELKQYLSKRNNVIAITLLAALSVAFIANIKDHLPQFKPNPESMQLDLQNFVQSAEKHVEEIKMRNPDADLTPVLENLAQMKEFSQLPHINHEQKQALIKSMEQSQKSLEGLTPPQFTNEQKELVDRSLNQLNDQLTDEQKQQIQKLANSLQDSPAMQNEAEKLKNLAQKPELLPSEQEALKSSLKSLSTQMQQPPAPPVPRALKQIPKEMKQKKEKSYDKLLKFSGILLFIFILFQLYKMFQPKGIHKVISDEKMVLEELKQSWEDLKKQKFSPEEEVIHYYNLFHDSIQKIHYADHEAPPSCIIHQDLKAINPRLKEASLTITDTFAHCFYGGMKVGQNELTQFRSAISTLLKFYQLK